MTMSRPIDNLTVLVTGAGQGPGAAFVRLLVARGAMVFAGYDGAADMDLLKGAVTMPLDPTNASSLRQAVGTVGAFAGRIDWLIVTGAGPEQLLNVITACQPLLTQGQGKVVTLSGPIGAADLPVPTRSVPADLSLEALLMICAGD
jgi:NAD(P)-dependent dehydrogenase (short-subunit alcohol dehydrogenase family)